ncbi:hypothetical protein LSH36_199g00004 [Paralvinella palmiformis]|uniref:Uncharacterized protein n=1 Tax=Paralvinella palmiformis TaxID=53620 RepID=A0AAD9N4R8_9ANNE|nr:hypothetical protein LSH36_199g00004 [Paralvinella palmiformis]
MSRQVPEHLQKEIRAVLLSKIGGVQLSDLQKDYRQLLCHSLDYRSLGFKNLKQFLLSIPDAARIVLVTKTNTEKVYGVSNAPLSSMNYTERKACYVPKEGEVLITSETTIDTNSSSAIMADHNKSLLREFVETNIRSNQKNLWTVCFPLRENFTDEDVIKIFSSYGTVAEISFTTRYGFVRFMTKQGAVDAFVALKERLDIRLASEGRNKNVAMPGSVHDSYEGVKNYLSKKPIIRGNSDNKTKSVGRGIIGQYADVSGINGPVTDPAGLGKRPSGAARHILRSASNSSCGSSISSSGAYQRAAPDMMQRPNAEQLKPQMFCSVGNGNINNEDMPYLEDVDVVPALEYDDGSTDEQPRNGINGDLGTTYGRGHHLGQPYGNDYACGELPVGRISQNDIDDRSYNLQVNSVHDGPEVFELFVKNFPYGTTAEKLVQPFISYGANGVNIVKNEYGKGTLAFVQFHDYEAAVEAFTNLDGAIFHGRNLVLGLSNSMICQEDILSKRLKKLTVKVKFDNITGSGKSHERRVILEDDDDDDDHHFDDVESNNRTMIHPNGPPLTSGDCLPLRYPSGQQSTSQHHRGNGESVYNRPHHNSGSQYKTRGKSQLPLCQDIDVGTASDSSGSNYEGRHGFVNFGDKRCQDIEIKIPGEHRYQAQQPPPSGHSKNWSCDSSVKSQRVLSGDGVPHNRGVTTPVSAYTDDTPDLEPGYTRREGNFVPRQEKRPPSLGNSEPTWVSPPVRYTSNSALHESMPTTVIKSHAMTFMSDTDSSVPATMRPQALERMMRDVCPGDRLLTVNDMLPEITVLVSYKENDTYFWGTLLNDHFKEGIEALLKLTGDMMEMSYTKPVSGNRAMTQYMGESCRVWIRGGDKVKADVVYIDYGNTETIDYSKLSGLPDRFWDLPPQAVPFRIQDPTQLTVDVNEKVHFTVAPSAGEFADRRMLSVSIHLIKDVLATNRFDGT